MENLLSRYRNVSILVAILFAQVLGLAIQVRRSGENESTRLIRVWAVSAIAPLEKVVVGAQTGISNLWHGYISLGGIRRENRDLKQQIENLRLEQARLQEDAAQARRLQALLGFKEQFISQTLAAQVIGSSGSELSRSIYIDKGSRDGVEKDMAVITADGVAGKILRVYKSVSQVLLVDDQTSGVGTILETSRLQGVLRGKASGEVVLEKVMNDEPVQPGEKVLTSGGDQIFPKGLLVGTVAQVKHGHESFLDIRVKPAADLSRLEEVLVITKKEEREPSIAEAPPVRAIDILTQRLPTVPDKPAIEPAKTQSTPGSAPAAPAKAGSEATGDAKPAAKTMSPSSPPKPQPPETAPRPAADKPQ
ncbi:MAG: rod shape-determining protein MreC [Acidobacteriales bacterium]|nr:rod shape-determining protein MreC [Terriglobales bacterium]